MMITDEWRRGGRIKLKAAWMSCGALVGLAWAASAAIPEPGVIYYGDARRDGQLQTAGNGTRVEAKVGDEVVARYDLGSNGSAGDQYLLRLDVVHPESGQELRPVGAVHLGNWIRLFVGGAQAQAVQVTERGRIVRLDVNADSTPDPGSCGNGVLDAGEACDPPVASACAAELCQANCQCGGVGTTTTSSTVTTSTSAPTTTSSTPTSSTVTSSTTTTTIPPVAVGSMDCKGVPGGTANCEIKATIAPTFQVATVQFNVTVSPQSPAPGLIGPLGFTTASGLPVPSLNETDGSSTVLIGWLSAFNPVLTGTVTLGTVQIPIPAAAMVGQRYSVAILSPTGSSNGSTSIPIVSGAAGVLEVGQPFLVCDVLPRTGSGVNQGEFGDGLIENIDIVSQFRASLLTSQRPPAGSALFSAMDSLPEDVPPVCGGDTTIENIDIVRCFRRSLLVNLPRYQRTGVGGACTSSLPGGGGGGGFLVSGGSSRGMGGVLDPIRLPHGSSALPVVHLAPIRSRSAGVAGEFQVPLYLKHMGSDQIDALQFAVQVVDERSVAQAAKVEFLPENGVQAPTLLVEEDDGTLLLGWLGGLDLPKRKTQSIGHLRIRTATPGRYAVAITSPSASRRDAHAAGVVSTPLHVSSDGTRRGKRLRTRCKGFGRPGIDVGSIAQCRARIVGTSTPAPVYWFSDRPDVLTIHDLGGGRVAVEARGPGRALLHIVRGDTGRGVKARVRVRAGKR